MIKCKIILIFFIGFCCQLYAQPDTINQIDSTGKKTGYWKIFGNDPKYKSKGYLDNAIGEEGRYIEGKKTGTWKTYFSNGKLKLELEYKNNRPNGKFTMWYESGCIQETGTWRNNRYVDEFKSYWENGVVRQEKFYNNSGKTDGKVIYRYVNGQIEMECNYVKGIEQGVLIRYYPNGDKKEEIHFNGPIQAESNHKFYKMKNPDVDLKKFETDCNGKINGAKNQEPNTKDDNEYRNGKLWKGKKYVYDKNGILIRIEIYENGKQVGQGLLIGNDALVDTSLVDGVNFDDDGCGNGPCKHCDGYSKLYDNRKRLCKDGEFKNGKLWNGKWYRYTKEGLIYKVEIYKNGKYFADGQLD